MGKLRCIKLINFHSQHSRISVKSVEQSAAISLITSDDTAWCQWLTPIILATQEAEIRRVTV
jgi:hypothetical protein